jgi:hypothetical protein
MGGAALDIASTLDMVFYGEASERKRVLEPGSPRLHRHLGTAYRALVDAFSVDCTYHRAFSVDCTYFLPAACFMFCVCCMSFCAFSGSSSNILDCRCTQCCTRRSKCSGSRKTAERRCSGGSVVDLYGRGSNGL